MEKLGFDNKDYELYKDYFGTNFVHKKAVAKDNVYQKHDKTFKEILKKSNEMSEFLETFVKIKNGMFQQNFLKLRKEIMSIQ